MSETEQMELARSARLADLGIEARMLAASEALNILHLGRVFQEAKKEVPHGEWENWVKTYTGMSVRSAQQHMQAYAAFGVNQDIASLGAGKVFRLMALPDGEREQFLETHQVEKMTVREIDEAVKAERAEKNRAVEEAGNAVAEANQRAADAERETEKARAARAYAERRMDEILNRPPEIPDDVLNSIAEKDRTIREQKAEIQRLAQVGNETLSEIRELRQALISAREDYQQASATIEDQAAMLEEQQDSLRRAQDELLDARSAMARGDAERSIPDRMSADGFAEAVNLFLGRVARVPQMRLSFAGMDPAERQEFDISLRTVEEWAAASRLALDTVHASGVVV